MPNNLRRQCASFSADTLIATPEGDKPISEIEVGDVILAYSEATEEVDIYHVSATHNQRHDSTLDITIDGETLHTTDEHPFYVVRDDEEQWVQAKHLHIGDSVLSGLGETGTVEDIIIIDQPQTMYNLTVALVATYMVGDGQWVVHNVNSCPITILDYNYEAMGEKLAINRREQLAIVYALRDMSPDGLIAVRPKAWGSDFPEMVYKRVSKPEGAVATYKGGKGLRNVKVPKWTAVDGVKTGKWHTMDEVLSDLDIGAVTRLVNGRQQSIPDEEFIAMTLDPFTHIRLPDPQGRLFANRINEYNGFDIAMHGSLLEFVVSSRAAADGLPYGVADNYFNHEPWAIFDYGGARDIMTGFNFVEKHLGHLVGPLERGLRMLK